jgi:DNA-binding transcriptional regulator YiaG
MKEKEFVRIRNDLGLNQAEMAELMDVSGLIIISHWENGFRNPNAMTQKIYRMLDQLPNNDRKKLLEWLKEYKISGKEKGKRKKT